VIGPHFHRNPSENLVANAGQYQKPLSTSP
jgi:hypothetical protein